MVDINDLPSDLADSLDRIVEFPHLLELDLKHMAMMNLDFTLGGIVSMQGEYENHVYECKEDEDTTRSLIRDNEIFCDGLRLAAYRMAAVTLVTRFQHWIGKLLADNKISRSKKSKDISTLVWQLQDLNKALGEGSTPVQFFDELEEVRNSVIHTDSQAEWHHQGKPRKVASQYRNSREQVEISEDQLKEAVTKMIEQVKWYENKLSALGTP